MRKEFNTRFLTVHTGICILLLLTPIVFNIPVNVTDDKSFPIHEAVVSIDYRISLYISLAASFIMSLELIFRLFVEPSLIFSFKKILATILLVLWLIISDCILLTYVITYHDLRFFNIIHQARFILLSWSVSIYLNLYSESKFWGSPLAIFPVITINLVRIFTSFYYYYTFPKFIVTILLSLVFLSIIILMVQSLRWFLFIYRTSKLQPITTNQYLCGVYIFASLCCNIGVLICIVTRSHPIWYNTTTEDLTSQSYVYTVFYVLFAAFQGRVIEREVIISQNSLEVKKMFIRYMSHEIRTPLNTVMMGLQHLQEDMKKYGESSQRIETVEDAIESCEVAIKTLNNMLLYDKIETKILALDKSTFLVKPFISKIIQLVRPQAIHLQVSISVIYCPTTDDDHEHHESQVNWDTLTINGDAEKLAQVIRNLISNALKFTPPNGDITIELRKVSSTSTSTTLSTSLSLPLPVPSDAVIELRVKDTGAGISLENQKKLFHGIIQFTPGKLQSGGGSGLGLFIAKGIVYAHGGCIDVTSEGEGCGSTFTVALPIVEAPAGLEPDQDDLTTPPSLPPLPKYSLPDTLLSGVTATRSDRNTTTTISYTKGIIGTTSSSTSSYGFWGRLWKTQIATANSKNKKDKNNNSNHDVSNRKPRSTSIATLLHENTESQPEYIFKLNNNCNNKNTIEKDEVKEPGGSGVSFRRESLRLAFSETTPSDIMNIENTAESSKPKRKPVILVVDDVASNRKMLHRLLQDRCEYSMDAVNGLEAVTMIRDSLSHGLKNIDVITMDYQMPVMDGPTATKQIRELGYKGIILGVTGNALIEDINNFIACGANKVLIKPLIVQAFDKALLELLPPSTYRT